MEYLAQDRRGNLLDSTVSATIFAQRAILRISKKSLAILSKCVKETRNGLSVESDRENRPCGEEMLSFIPIKTQVV